MKINDRSCNFQGIYDASVKPSDAQCTLKTLKTVKILRSVKNIVKFFTQNLKHTVFFGKNWKNDTVDKKQLPKGKGKE